MLKTVCQAWCVQDSMHFHHLNLGQLTACHIWTPHCGPRTACHIRTPHCGPEQHATLGALIFHHTQHAAMVLRPFRRKPIHELALPGMACAERAYHAASSLSKAKLPRCKAWGSKASRHKAATVPKLARQLLLSAVKERTERALEERKQKAEGKQLADFLDAQGSVYLRYLGSLQKRHTIGGPEISDYAKSVCDFSEQTLSEK